MFGFGGTAIAASIAEIAIWMTDLSDGNVATLAAGVRADTVGTPSYYWRLVGQAGDDEVEYMGTGMNLTLAGTLPSVTHPFSDAGPKRYLLVRN